MTKVAIVEDNATIRSTFRQWIDAAPDLRCVCVCSSAEQALAEIPRLNPDVVLMDIHLPPGETGIACTARLKEKLPNVQVIIVTVYRNHELIFQALEAGACGYLLKRSSPEELLKAINEVRSGGAPMTGEIARMLVEAFQKKPTNVSGQELTEREEEILVLLAEGLSNKEIADRVNISYDTVRAHLRHIYEKLHVRGRTEAVKKYLTSPKAVTMKMRGDARSPENPGR
jgi:DNA-binding NarL/FixJ family response regulator